MKLKIGDWIETNDENPKFQYCIITEFEDNEDVGSFSIVYAKSPFYPRTPVNYFRYCVKKILPGRKLSQKLMMIMLENS